MRETVIMYPFDVDEISQNELKAHKESWENLKQYLDHLKEGKNITFDELLAELHLTEESYLLAIRSLINTPTIFLRRNLMKYELTITILLVLLYGGQIYACAV